MHFPTSTRILKPERLARKDWRCRVLDFFKTVIYTGHGSTPEEARKDAQRGRDNYRNMAVEA